MRKLNQSNNEMCSKTLNVYETKLESIKGSYCQPWAVSSIQHVSYSVDLDPILL